MRIENISREDLVHLFEGPWRALRAVIQKKVIDFHTHSFQPTKQALTQAGMLEIRKRQENSDFTDDLIQSMDIHGVAMACVQPPKLARSVPYAQFAASLSRYPDRLVLFCDPRQGNTREERMAMAGDPFGTADPLKAAETLRTRLQQGAKGIGELNYGDMPVENAFPVVELAMEFDVPILFGVRSGEYAERNVTYVAPIAARFPKAKIVLGDAGGKGFIYGGGWQAILVAAAHENICLEIGGGPVELIDEAVRNLGAERVIFGSDWGRPDPRPYLPPNHRDAYMQWRNLNAVALSNTTEAQRDLILYKNAARLLKLNAD